MRRSIVGDVAERRNGFACLLTPVRVEWVANDVDLGRVGVFIEPVFKKLLEYLLIGSPVADLETFSEELLK